MRRCFALLMLAVLASPAAALDMATPWIDAGLLWSKGYTGAGFHG